MYKINTNERFKNSTHADTNADTNEENNTENNYNTNIYGSSINEDTKKMHILPLYCPMTPKSYTDFFNDKPNLPDVAPYRMEVIKHPKQGWKHNIEYRNFYSDFKKDALQFTSKKNVNEFSFINDNNNNNNNNKDKPLIINSKNMKMYIETKPNPEFAKPMKMTGSNKVNDLFDNCMNKKTFEYKRYSSITPHNREWVKNPIFIQDISQETINLKSEYMNSREQSNSNLYSSVFEDMYLLGDIPLQYGNSTYIENILNQLYNI